jgi:hypothetical protein
LREIISKCSLGSPAIFGVRAATYLVGVSQLYEDPSVALEVLSNNLTRNDAVDFAVFYRTLIGLRKGQLI